MQNIYIETNDQGMETIEHGSLSYPIAAYDELFSLFALNEVSWHWHNEIEIVFVAKGTTKLHFLNGDDIINEGEAVFVNSNVLHRFTQVGDIDCRIINFVLSPIFIGGSIESAIYQKYVKPICDDNSIKYIKFGADNNSSSKAISLILEAYDNWKSKYSELIVRNKLSEFWFQLISIVEPNASTQINDLSSQRLEAMMKFIHNNYNRSLTVRIIASSIGVSESECYKLFKSILETSPIEYMHSQRMKKALSKLTYTDDAIVHIALDLGYQSPAYFSKRFKDAFQLTPRMYRNKTKPIESTTQ